MQVYRILRSPFRTNFRMYLKLSDSEWAQLLVFRMLLLEFCLLELLSVLILPLKTCREKKNSAKKRQIRQNFG